MNRVCKNCNIHFKGNFCPQCGQKAHTERFTFKHIFSEGIHAFTHADKGFFTLLKKMMYIPATVAYEFIVEGKRKKYFNLFTFFVLITTISAFVVGRELALKEELFNEKNEYGHAFNLYSKLLLIITIPLLAFFVWLIYQPKTKLLYSEYTVFAMVLMTLKAITDIITDACDYSVTRVFKAYFDTDSHIIYALVLATIAGGTSYFFHKKTGLSSLMRAVLTGLMFVMLQGGLTIFIVWAVFNRFGGVGVLEVFGIRIGG
jgi:Protein of unknown function (DUF3667)